MPKLLGPLLTTDGVRLVKGFYRRLLKVSGSEDANGLTQFFADGEDYTPRTSTVSLADRPPMMTLRLGLGSGCWRRNLLLRGLIDLD